MSSGRKKEHDGGVFTSRGFEDFCEVIDDYGNHVVVRESSAAEKHCVWIINYAGTGDEVVSKISPHLTAEQARRVAAALLRFADRAERGDL